MTRMYSHYQGRGEAARAAKLTETEVREIKAAPRSGRFRVSNIRLARKYGVSDVSIGRIRRGETWAHVDVNSENERSGEHG